MENKNCKKTFEESYDTYEWMSHFCSSERRYCSLFTTCAHILTSKWSTSVIGGRSLDLQPPVLEPLPPACTAALSYTTVIWENFYAVLHISKTHLPRSHSSLLPVKQGCRNEKKVGNVLWTELYLTCNWLTRVGLLAMVSSAEPKLKLM